MLTFDLLIAEVHIYTLQMNAANQLWDLAVSCSNHLRWQWSFSREELTPDLRDPYCSQQL